eukprot:scaffold44865_cov60-Phaeocystis_antarctica.AAC.2
MPHSRRRPRARRHNMWHVSTRPRGPTYPRPVRVTLAACGGVDGGVEGEGDWRHGWRVEDRGPPWRRPLLDGLGEGGSGEDGGGEALPLGSEPRAVG